MCLGLLFGRGFLDVIGEFKRYISHIESTVFSDSLSPFITIINHLWEVFYTAPSVHAEVMHVIVCGLVNV